VFRNQRPPYGWRRGIALVRTTADESATAAWVRSVFRDLDPALPIEMQPLTREVSTFVRRPRFNAAVLGFIALIATLLAAVGIYGLVSYLVVERTREIGIRIAVGATPGNVTTLMLAHALRWTLAGTAIGLIGAYWAGKAMTAILHSTPDRDLTVPVLCAALLVSIAVVAAWAAIAPLPPASTRQSPSVTTDLPATMERPTSCYALSSSP
jgi:putative ABC transport system permease protein